MVSSRRSSTHAFQPSKPGRNQSIVCYEQSVRYALDVVIACVIITSKRSFRRHRSCDGLGQVEGGRGPQDALSLMDVDVVQYTALEAYEGRLRVV